MGNLKIARGECVPGAAWVTVWPVYSSFYICPFFASAARLFNPLALTATEFFKLVLVLRMNWSVIYLKYKIITSFYNVIFIIHWEHN